MANINFICLISNLLPLTIVAITFVLCILMFFKLCRYLREENLFIVKGLGIQLTTKYLLRSKSKFIPQENVQRVFINEVIFRLKVIHLLSLFVEKEAKDKVVLLFVETLPNLASLRIIYNRIKKFEKRKLPPGIVNKGKLP